MESSDNRLQDQRQEEQALVKLYMELTGRSEGNARSAYMLVSREGDSPELDRQQPGLPA